jgi:hypothetical protein
VQKKFLGGHHLLEWWQCLKRQECDCALLSTGRLISSFSLSYLLEYFFNLCCPGLFIRAPADFFPKISQMTSFNLTVNNIGNIIKACMLHSRGGGDEEMSALLSVHNSTLAQGAT